MTTDIGLGTNVYTHVHTHVYTHIHTCLHTHLHICLHLCLSIRCTEDVDGSADEVLALSCFDLALRAFIHMSIHMSHAHVPMLMSVHTSMRVSIHMYMHMKAP